MKYPAKQFDVLKSTIKTLSKHFAVRSIHPSNLHYLAYQQFADGQQHNQIYISGSGEVARMHKITDLTGWTKLIQNEFSFELYPDGCDDSHCLTAVNAVLKSLSL